MNPLGNLRAAIVSKLGAGRRNGCDHFIAMLTLLSARPVLRPGNQRSQPPAFVFPPITPPKTADIDGTMSNAQVNSHRESLWSGTHSPRTPSHSQQQAFERHFLSAESSPSTRQAHRRAHSYSTVDDQHAHIRGSDAGAYKVVIERPYQARPSTADEPGIPLL